MPRFSRRSKAHLHLCHPFLRKVFHAVVHNYDCTIIEGMREPERQQYLFDSGASKTLDSLHLPQDDSWAHAVDASPYPIPKRWGDGIPKERARFYHFAGYVKAIAEQFGGELRWGGDWDGDLNFQDQTFDDLIHFEISHLPLTV